MTKSSALRIALGADAVSIWSSEIFGGAESTRLRDFLSRAFAVHEVEGVELRRSRGFGRVRYRALAGPAHVWQKLSRALRSRGPSSTGTGAEVTPADAALVYLDGPGESPVRVSRIGGVLSTWNLRGQTRDTLRLWHPWLRHRRDVVFRLEEELAALIGVEQYAASALTAAVSIRFDPATTTRERIVRELERAWPRVLGGLDGPPSRTRWVAASGLVGVAYAGQYLVPALRPLAVAGVAVYALPNVVNAAKQLTRGQVGVSALYTTGLAFMFVSGMPFTASVMAALMQLWPQLAHRKFVASQRRIFAGQRRRPSWARVLHTDGAEIEVNIDDLERGDRVTVRSGEVIPVDGLVEEGFAAVAEHAAFGGNRVEDKEPGDAVSAGALLRDGTLTIRVGRAGGQTATSHIASLLPRTPSLELPSSLEAERIANRNAKPALAIAALSVLTTQAIYPAQAVIRPDYATGPRIGAQLAALTSIAHAFQAGVSLRKPSALDHLSGVEVIVIDDSAGLERRGVEVASVQTVEGVSAELVVGYATAAQRNSRNEQGRAIVAFVARRNVPSPKAGPVQRQAGVARYRDGAGSTIEIAATRYVSASRLEIPHFTGRLRRRRSLGRHEAGLASDQPSLRPLWVLRNGAVIGVISFTRTGASVGKQLVASLVEHEQLAGKGPRIIYLSRGGQADAEALARSVGIEHVQGGLSPAAKAELIRGLGRRTLWIGDGSDPDAQAALAASTTSISVAPLARTGEDAADILLPYEGLSSVPFVLQLGRAHAARVALDYRTMYATNLLGVAGAFAAGISPLQVGLLSNLGTGLVYSRHAMFLSSLAQGAEQKRARLRRSINR